MSLFQDVTRASVVDCVVDEKVTFIVQPGQMGLAIGKGGERIKRARLLAKRLFGVAEVRIL